MPSPTESRQEGRALGLANKMRAYTLQDNGLKTMDANMMLGFDDDERTNGACDCGARGREVSHSSISSLSHGTRQAPRMRYRRNRGSSAERPYARDL
jgi:hypothetical protein